MLQRFIICVQVILFLSGCAGRPAKPCSQGGQPARVNPPALIGRRTCNQILDDAGNYLNEGKYYEWYISERIATVGEYKKGKKSGRWIEYDEDGKITSQADFEDGKELPPAYELRKQPKK